MICSECQEFDNNYITIGNGSYCYYCTDTFKLVKCPSKKCNNVISLNGYDESFDTDSNTCNNCNIMVCDSCITRQRSKYCNECINY